MKGRRQVLLCVVDLADFAGSLPYGVLQGIVSRWGEARAEVGPRIVIAANKMDLLPRAATLRRLEVWVRTQWRASGLPLPSAVHVVSAARGSGISQLSESLAKECGVRGDVWVIGAQNAGKSSVINALKHDTDGGPGRKAPQVTEAPVPGTTIGIVRLEGILPSHRCRVFDTPGVEHPFQWSSTATPLSPTDWKITYDGVSVSLSPSIGNWSFPCLSHYWIVRNEIRWAAQWTPEQIEAGRAADRRAKRGHHGPTAKKQPSQPAEEATSPGLLSRLWQWLSK